MSSDAEAKSGAETRRVPRKTLRTLGEIVGQGSLQPIDCSILDLSATGAKISLGSAGQKRAFMPSLAIPTEFCLRIPHDNLAVDCRLAWQRGEEIGVEFVSTFRPIKALKPKAKAGFNKPAAGLHKVR